MDSDQNKPKPPIFHAVNGIARNSGLFLENMNAHDPSRIEEAINALRRRIGAGGRGQGSGVPGTAGGDRSDVQGFSIRHRNYEQRYQGICLGRQTRGEQLGISLVSRRLRFAAYSFGSSSLACNRIARFMHRLEMRAQRRPTT